MVPNTGTSNWQSIAQQVTVEMDSHKLCVLVNQLCAALDEEAERKRRTPPPSFAFQATNKDSSMAEVRSRLLRNRHSTNYNDPISVGANA